MFALYMVAQKLAQFLYALTLTNINRFVAEVMHESIAFCSACTMSLYRKFTFPISLDEFL